MLIGDWMTQKVITTTPDTSMMKAAKLMKDNNIRRLPVVDGEGRVVGIVSDRDIKESSPSKATSLDMHELYYLLSEIKIKDIMTKDVFVMRTDDTVEKAAVLMMKKRIGVIPVVDEKQKISGIISDSDVFKVLVTITGAMHGGIKLGFRLPNTPGSLKAVLDDLKRFDARIMSILTSFEPVQDGFRHVYIRIQEMDSVKMGDLRTTVGSKYDLLHWVKDEVNLLVS